MAALTYWREMARVLKPDDRDERPWYLLALRRAQELETRIEERRAFVFDQLARADAALQAGRPNEAVTIRAMLKDKYSHYTDLADLLGHPPVRSRNAPATEAGPARPQIPASHGGVHNLHHQTSPDGSMPDPGRDIGPTPAVNECTAKWSVCPLACPPCLARFCMSP